MASKILSRLYWAVLLSIGAASVNAGTFSVTGVEFISQQVQDGGMIGSGVDPQYFDVRYRHYKNIGAINNQNLSAFPTVQSEFKWKLRWTRTIPGEPTPVGVTCVVATYGHGYAFVNASYGYNNYGNFNALVQVLDEIFPRYIDGHWDRSWHAGYPYYNGTLADTAGTDKYIGATDWVQVSTDVYEATAHYIVNNVTSMSASNSPTPYNAAGGVVDAFVDLSVNLRIVEIRGQTVAPRL